jgi:hypothetical protein
VYLFTWWSALIGPTQGEAYPVPNLRSSYSQKVGISEGIFEAVAEFWTDYRQPVSNWEATPPEAECTGDPRGAARPGRSAIMNHG